jgi:hypothetical protein
MAVFFAFNLFVCVNAALPILWTVSNDLATRLAAALALVGFMTLRHPVRQIVRREGLKSGFAAALLLLFLVEWGRPLIPPAPLRLGAAGFGRGFDRRTLAVTAPLDALNVAAGDRVYAVSAIRAPVGLRDRVRHRWVVDGTEVYRSPYHVVVGGRREGFRLWTSARMGETPRGPLDLWVETEGGQIIGRARLAPPRAAPPS